MLTVTLYVLGGVLLVVAGFLIGGANAARASRTSDKFKDLVSDADARLHELQDKFRSNQK
jgi:hypothetical protein